ncbi:hypothetical protein GQ55_4G287700 [Panicum hallii var. hallii]|uniref:Uncharacterized protein n=2 Tax=Panicum hallii TaxID=206008 RepID=A0A2T7E172_9POAL|nr:hypothetical protein PAHAL_4G274700 [Panicum hallii]PUZ61578.1 hypothetical protein GQ55_4G287700 [Panicum hallii var. hallii]
MTRSKVAVPLLLLLVVLSGSWACRPAAAARPLLADDGRWVEQAAPASAGSVIVLPSVWRLWHKLPPLQMKPAGASCKGSTWDPNNGCPPPTKP